MRVAVTDACIFIGLIELDMNTAFFQLDMELHTTVAVINELFPEQKQVLEAYQSINKLQVHNLEDEDFQEMTKIPFPRGLSQEDRSVIYLAKKLGGAIVISSDKLVRDFAGKLHLHYHGIFWILDQMVSSKVIQTKMAIHILNDMPKINSLYQGATMKREIHQRIHIWKG
jgi:predicted nucleic acid-binding protein